MIENLDKRPDLLAQPWASWTHDEKGRPVPDDGEGLLLLATVDGKGTMVRLHDPSQMTFRDGCRQELEKLRQMLSALSVEAPEVRRELQREALHASGSFKRKVLHALKAGLKDDGSVDPQELEKLRSESESAIRLWTETVLANPTPSNMKGLLSQLTSSMVTALDGGSTAVGEAWQVLGKVSAEAARSAEARFRQSPSTANLRAMLASSARAMQLGGDGCIGEPKRLERLREETTYTTRAGDTLAGISKSFYGSPGYWDVIYFSNAKAIGENPDTLKVGTVLQIP